MNPTRENGNYQEALWRCDDCQVWWASQSWPGPTRLLLQVPPALAEQLSWDAYRGWKMSELAHCPECHKPQEAPLYGDADTDEYVIYLSMPWVPQPVGVQGERTGT